MRLVYDSPSAKLYEGVAQQLDLIPDNSVDLTVTSPPYNLKGLNHWPSQEQGGSWGSMDSWYEDDMPENEYQDWQVTVLDEIYRVTKDGGSLFYNHKQRRVKKFVGLHPWEWIRRSKWTFSQQITWDRGSTMNHQNALFWSHDELIFWLTKGEARLNKECAKWSTVWKMNFDVSSWHPAPFPLELATRCILACSKEGDTVLDPFNGSGTTCVAAQNLHRIGIGVDKSLEYLDKSKLRLAQRGM